MIEADDRFIIYNTDLPITLDNREKIFEENSFEDISLDIIASYTINISDTPRNNHFKIKDVYRSFQDFKKLVKEKNNRDLPVVYERI